MWERGEGRRGEGGDETGCDEEHEDIEGEVRAPLLHVNQALKTLIHSTSDVFKEVTKTEESCKES